MSGVKNRKLCWNCEGSVHLHATKCPYCGTDLTAAEVPSVPQQQQPSPYGYTPPPPPPDEVPLPPFSFPTEPYGYQAPPQTPPQWQEQAVDSHPIVDEELGAKSRAEVLPMLLLIPGTFFLLFGLILVLFSKEGLLTLHWNARYWFIYLLLSAPLIYFGWKALRRRPVPAPIPVNKEPLPPLYPTDKR